VEAGVVILGLDTGTRTCGWAQLDEAKCEFVDLGVVVQPKRDDAARTITLERERRANLQAQVIAAKAPGCRQIIVEQMSLPRAGGVQAAVSIALSWGIVLGVVATLESRPRLLTIAPQRWQREVMPYAGRQVDYDELAAVAAEHILRRHPRAHAQLMRIPIGQREHALDAAMIALVGALRPHRCDEVGGAAA
jgi:hypothetical protein